MSSCLDIYDNKKIIIELADNYDLNQCSNELYKSSFGKIYYPTENVVLNILKDAKNKDYVYVAKKNTNILGFIWFSTKGMFGKFPYINMIFIFPEFRRCGLSKVLLEYFENCICKENKSPKIKIFLLVKKGNDKAFNLYSKLGYFEICTIKNLFRKGIDEKLMMKEFINFK